MSNTFFRFKRFRIEQGGAAMKVGTDGVLLGAWSRMEAAQHHILDIGTGTGVIALMLAQRRETLAGREDAAFQVDAVEIDADAFRQAADNVAASPWSAHIRLFHTDFQSFATDPKNCRRYDHILSNPPYYAGSLHGPDAGRNRARHADTLPYDTLVEGAARLLAPGGIFSVILPVAESKNFMTRALAAGLHPRRRTEVSTTPGAPPKRILLELGMEITALETESLTLSDTSGNGFSEAYRALTGEFYLNF